METIGLFPLGLVLLPGERVPLHIFEPRYRDLIGKCVEEDSDFGIVLVEASGLRKIGTRAAVVEVLERFDDGRLNIVVEGGDRFSMDEIKDERIYLTADVEPYLDDAPPPTDQEYEETLSEYRKVVSAGSLELEEPVPDYRGLAFKIAAQMELDPEARQELLEIRAEQVRLARIRQLLELAAVAMQKRMIEKRAATNGHVKK